MAPCRPNGSLPVYIRDVLYYTSYATGVSSLVPLVSPVAVEVDSGVVVVSVSLELVDVVAAVSLVAVDPDLTPLAPVRVELLACAISVPVAVL